MSLRLLKEIEIKIKIIKWFKTKNGRYVNWVFKNVAWNFGENARTYLITTMG